MVNQRAVAFGVASKLNFNETTGIGVEGWWLIPSNARGSEQESLTTTVNIGTGTTPVFVTITGPAGTNWDTRPDWWFIDGRLACTPIWRNSTFLAGFRYDHFSTRLQFPSGAFGFPSPLVSGSDAGDITVNSYIPYVGLQYNAVASGGSYLTLWALFWPWVPADVKFGETFLGPVRADAGANFNKRGYFFEFFGQYDCNIYAGSSVGAFFRWNVLSGRGDINTSFAPSGLSVGDKFTFDRNTVTFGGQVSLNFDVPY